MGAEACKVQCSPPACLRPSFPFAEEYKPNPAYDPMLSLHLQPLLGGTSTAAAATAGGTPAPEARGGDGTPAPGTRGGSEAPDAMEQDT